MSYEELTELQLLEGTFSLIFAIISTLVGIRIFIKCFRLKRKDLIGVGLAHTFISGAWYPSAIAFVSFVLFDVLLSDIVYLLIMNSIFPIAVVGWVYFFCDVMYKQLKKVLFPIYLAFYIIWEVLLIYFLYTNPIIIGTVEGLFDSKHTYLGVGVQAFSIFTALVIGVVFGYKTTNAGVPELVWKGRLIITGFISFTIGALFDSAISMTSITIVIIRLILISSAIQFYFGFFMPERLKK